MTGATEKKHRRVPSPDDAVITEEDHSRFLAVVSDELTDDQRNRAETPEATYPNQPVVMALHWHPEHVAMELIESRIRNLYPAMRESLIIPTQHNVIEQVGEYAGVEVDCYSKGFNQKVQILLHFERKNLDRADVLRSMLAHTFKYRSSQLFDFIRAVVKPDDAIIQRALKVTPVDKKVIQFTRVHVQKIDDLLRIHGDRIPPAMIKNKVIANYFEALKPVYGSQLTDNALAFLKAVKAQVKASFPLHYFYRTSEIIEEARRLNAGIVIPHPEQFWPILLADYDVDGYEVWNPQSSRYTEFLISVLDKKNRQAGPSKRRLLVFMGDDTHMGEKIKSPAMRDAVKAQREIGYQPPWDDDSIRKRLIVAGFSRDRVIEEYRSRLAG
ncbi:hypothetical protein JCM14469_32830 [Desulfatiferula olefinivorans]